MGNFDSCSAPGERIGERAPIGQNRLVYVIAAQNGGAFEV
jgi:hypothetical protein